MKDMEEVVLEVLGLAMKVNAEKAAIKDCKADDALKYTQAAVNAANAMRSIRASELDAITARAIQSTGGLPK
jgi:hypothetical protein